MKYYVYHLIDPRDGSVFYVGKGTGNRKSRHRVAALRWTEGKPCHNLHLYRKIKKILGLGLQLVEFTVLEVDNEEDAYEMEKAEIKRIGLCNLCNITPGGDGSGMSGEFHSLETREKMRESSLKPEVRLAKSEGCRKAALKQHAEMTVEQKIDISRKISAAQLGGKRPGSGENIAKAHLSFSDEKKAEIAARKSTTLKEHWESLDPERFAEIKQKRAEGIRKASKKISEAGRRSWASLTPEERKERGRKISEGNRRYWDSLTPEEREEKSRKNSDGQREASARRKREKQVS